MKSGTSTAGTKTVFVSRTRMILISPDSLDIRIFSGFGVSHFALGRCSTHLSISIHRVHNNHRVENLNVGMIVCSVDYDSDFSEANRSFGIATIHSRYGLVHSR